MSNNQDQCDHRSQNCDHSTKFGCEQTLDEIQFESSIFYACIQGDLEKVKSIISKRGSEIANEQDKTGYTCLHYAARNGHLNICRLLLINYRVNPNLKTLSCQSTPLHRAAYIGNFEIVQLLLEQKSNPHDKDCDGKTALHKCVEQLTSKATSGEKHSKLLNTAKALLKFDSKIAYEKDNNEKTPLDIYPDLIQFSI
jgi:ankyrin repeat protein